MQAPSVGTNTTKTYAQNAGSGRTVCRDHRVLSRDGAELEDLHLQSARQQSHQHVCAITELN